MLLYLYPKCCMIAEIRRIRRAAGQAIRSGSSLIQMGVNISFIFDKYQPPPLSKCFENGFKLL